MHSRQKIKQAIMGLLTGLLTTGNRVYGNRFYPLAKNEANALRVFGLQESFLSIDGTRMRERSFTLTVEAVVHDQAEAVETELNKICAEVEAAIDGKALPVGGAAEVMLVSAEDNYEASGEKVVGSVLMRFQIDYATRVGDAEVIL